MFERLRNRREKRQIQEHHDRFMQEFGGKEEFARVLAERLVETAKELRPGEAFVMNPLTGETVKYPRSDTLRDSKEPDNSVD